MTTYASKYKAQSKTIFLKSRRELLECINELGGDLDLSTLTSGLSSKIKRENGDAIFVGAFNLRKLLMTLNEIFDVKIDVNGTTQMGSLVTLKFLEDPTFNSPVEEESPEPEVEPEEEQEEVVEPEQSSEAPDEVLEETQASALPEVDKPPAGKLTLPEGVDEPNWKALSVPTFGKKKLATLADGYGFKLNSKSKYQDMVASFKEMFYDKFFTK